MHFKTSICILYYSSINIPSIFNLNQKRGSSLITMDTYRRTYRGLLVQRLPPLSAIGTWVVLFGVLNFLNG